MEQELTVLARKNVAKKVLEEKEGTHDPNAYTKEYRREMHLEQMARDKKKDEEGKDTSMFKEYNAFMAGQKPDGPLPVYTKEGTVR
jgi:hypothetical protein